MTKYIYAVYNTTTKEWTIRDNGVVIEQGQGIMSWARAIVRVEQEATKPVRKSAKH